MGREANFKKLWISALYSDSKSYFGKDSVKKKQEQLYSCFNTLFVFRSTHIAKHPEYSVNYCHNKETDKNGFADLFNS
jgi:hypothetical protein